MGDHRCVQRPPYQASAAEGIPLTVNKTEARGIEGQGGFDQQCQLTSRQTTVRVARRIDIVGSQFVPSLAQSGAVHEDAVAVTLYGSQLSEAIANHNLLIRRGLARQLDRCAVGGGSAPDHFVVTQGTGRRRHL